MRIFVFLFAVLALLAAPALVLAETASPAAPRIQKTLVYDLYAGGFRALDATVTLKEDRAAKQGRYALELVSATAETFKMIAPWSGSFKVAGWLQGVERQPETYAVYSKLTEKIKTKDFRYDASGKLLSFKATENGKDKTPDPVGPELTPPGITDVLTTTLKALDRLHATGACTGASLIYDGDRTFTLSFKDTGPEVLAASDYNAYAGEARGCTFEMIPEKGKWKKKLRGWLMLQDQARKLSSEPIVWFARLPGDKTGEYVPVRLQIKTNYGTLILHLRSAAGTDGKIFTPAIKKAP